MDICERDDLFFLVFTCFWAEKWTYADVMTLKEPVLLLRSENVISPNTLSLSIVFLSFYAVAKNACCKKIFLSFYALNVC